MSCEYLLMFYAQAEISECIVHALCVCGCVCVHVYLWAYYFMCTIDDLCSSRCLCEYFLFLCSMYLQVSLGVLMMLTLVTITAQVEAPLPQVPYLKVIMKIWVYFFMNSHNRIGFCSYFAVFYWGFDKRRRSSPSQSNNKVQFNVEFYFCRLPSLNHARRGRSMIPHRGANLLLAQFLCIITR